MEGDEFEYFRCRVNEERGESNRFRARECKQGNPDGRDAGISRQNLNKRLSMMELGIVAVPNASIQIC
jgi:hypothetical protein